MAPLPYRDRAQLQDQGGQVVPGHEEIPCAVWDATGTTNARGGRHYSHEGQAPIRFHAELEKPNRQLHVAAGPRAGTYKVLRAARHDSLPHVALELASTTTRSR